MEDGGIHWNAFVEHSWLYTKIIIIIIFINAFTWDSGKWQCAKQCLVNIYKAIDIASRNRLLRLLS